MVLLFMLINWGALGATLFVSVVRRRRGSGQLTIRELRDDRGAMLVGAASGAALIPVVIVVARQWDIPLGLLMSAGVAFAGAAVAHELRGGSRRDVHRSRG